MAEERKSVPITIRFKAEVVDQLKEVARRENRSFNGAVEEAVEQYLRARRARQQEATDAR